MDNVASYLYAKINLPRIKGQTHYEQERQPHLQDLSPLHDAYNIFNFDLVVQESISFNDISHLELWQPFISEVEPFVKFW